MFKSLLLIVCASLLSLVLLGIGAWIHLQFTPLGGAIKEYGDQWYEHGDPFEVMRRSLLVMQFIMAPAICVFVGLSVGVISRKSAWQIAALGLLPFAVFMSLASSWSTQGMLLSLAYLILSALSAYAVASLRARAAGGMSTR